MIQNSWFRMFSPLIIASYVLTRPTTSSDLTVRISEVYKMHHKLQEPILPFLRISVHQTGLYHQVAAELQVSKDQLNERGSYHQQGDGALSSRRSDSNRTIEVFTCSTIAKSYFTISSDWNTLPFSSVSSVI